MIRLIDNLLIPANIRASNNAHIISGEIIVPNDGIVFDAGLLIDIPFGARIIAIPAIYQKLRRGEISYFPDKKIITGTKKVVKT